MTARLRQLPAAATKTRVAPREHLDVDATPPKKHETPREHRDVDTIAAAQHFDHVGGREVRARHAHVQLEASDRKLFVGDGRPHASSVSRRSVAAAKLEQLGKVHGNKVVADDLGISRDSLWRITSGRFDDPQLSLMCAARRAYGIAFDEWLEREALQKSDITAVDAGEEDAKMKPTRQSNGDTGTKSTMGKGHARGRTRS